VPNDLEKKHQRECHENIGKKQALKGQKQGRKLLGRPKPMTNDFVKVSFHL
jgi:hypothetical protein